MQGPLNEGPGRESLGRRASTSPGPWRLHRGTACQSCGRKVRWRAEWSCQEAVQSYWSETENVQTHLSQIHSTWKLRAGGLASRDGTRREQCLGSSGRHASLWRGCRVLERTHRTRQSTGTEGSRRFWSCGDTLPSQFWRPLCSSAGMLSKHGSGGGTSGCEHHSSERGVPATQCEMVPVCRTSISFEQVV